MVFLLALDVYALHDRWFSRRLSQFLAGSATCVLLDVALILRRGRFFVPLSGFITSLGLFILCDSIFLYPYVLAGALAILSKHLIRIDGRHVYNPLNFGMVAALLLLPHDVTMGAGRWTMWYSGAAAVAGLGLLAARHADRLDVALSYVAVFALGAWARSRWQGFPMMVALGPMTGAAFMLFAFYMVTDPATTPATRGRRVVFGACVAALEGVLRWREWPASPLYALFICSSLRTLFPAETR